MIIEGTTEKKTLQSIPVNLRIWYASNGVSGGICLSGERSRMPGPALHDRRERNEKSLYRFRTFRVNVATASTNGVDTDGANDLDQYVDKQISILNIFCNHYFRVICKIQWLILRLH